VDGPGENLHAHKGGLLVELRVSQPIRHGSNRKDPRGSIFLGLDPKVIRTASVETVIDRVYYERE
jgi:hypothetical protein